MKKHRRIIRALLIGIGVLAVLILALHFFLPRFINSDAMQRRIKNVVAEETGGVLEFQQINVSVLPLPHADIRKVAFFIPGRLGGTVEALSAYPEWRSLLSGNIRLAQVRVKEPRFRIDLAKAGDAETDRESPPTAIAERIASLAIPVPPALHGLSGEIDNGSVEFFEAGKPVCSFQGIDLYVEVDPERVAFQLNAGSSLWEKMSAGGTFDPSKMKSKGRVDLVRFRPEALAALFPPESARILSEAEVNGRISFEMDGPEHLTAGMAGSLPRLVLTYEGRTINAAAGKFEAAFEVRKNRTTLSLTRLILDQPSLEAVGELRWENTPPSVHLNLEGKRIDLPSVKEAVLTFAKDVPHIEKICDTMKAGELVTASYQAQGGSFSDLWKIENMQVAAVLEQGRASLPESNQEVTQVGGKVGISGGVLIAEVLNAKLGNSQVTDGRVEVNLSEHEIPYTIDILVDADVGQLRSVLAAYAEDETLKRELSRITRLEGTSTVNLALKKTDGPVSVTLSASGFNLSGAHEEVPYGLGLKGGRVQLKDSRLSVTDVALSAGNSTVTGLSGRFDSHGDIQTELKAAVSRVDLGEMFQWLSRYASVEKALQPVDSLKGSLVIDGLSLNGPLSEPGKWQLQVGGEARKIEIRTQNAKNPVLLTSARFDTNRDGGKGKISFNDAQVVSLDTNIIASGSIDYSALGAERVDVRLGGGADKKSMERLAEILEIPPQLIIRPPLRIKTAYVQWEKGRSTTIRGDFTIGKDASVALDFTHTPEALSIRKASVSDKASDALLALNVKGREVNLEFTGHLDQSTLNRLFIDSQYQHGWIKGDFKAQIFLDRPMTSRANGRLEGEDLIFPRKLGETLEIDRMALKAQGDRVRIESIALGWGDMRFSLKGDLSVSEAGFVIDGDLESDGLDLNCVKGMSGGSTAKPAVTEGNVKGTRDVLLTGAVRVKSGYLKHGMLHLEPFHADITLSPEGLSGVIKEARLCGIDFPGEFTLGRELASLDFRPAAVEQDLEPTVVCLTEDRSQITGRVDLAGRITGVGRPDRLGEVLQGNVKMKATNGRYERDIVLGRIFAYLNVTELFRGNVPSLEKQGFVYHSIDGDVDLVKGGRLQGTIVIDGVSMDIGAEGEIDLVNETLDLKVLVAPLKTVDWFVSRLPLIGYVLGGSLVSIPVRVSGSFDDPRVTALSPTAVGEGLIGILGRTFSLPVKIIEPLVPREKKGAGENREAGAE